MSKANYNLYHKNKKMLKFICFLNQSIFLQNAKMNIYLTIRSECNKEKANEKKGKIRIFLLIW